ncbi:MAG TPA: peptidoglycan bridge formation protein FemAB, partial [Spirochaetales bacterium]|nr:peptidoglycan bridge formation protein FemAB [Spirochaetales bacterium]
MNLIVRKKSLLELMPTALVWQTSFWGDMKSKLGWMALAFDIEADGNPAGDILVLTRSAGSDISVAYAPFGPEILPEPDARGPYLAALSEALQAQLDPSCVFIRYDLPWLSPYAEDAAFCDENGLWLGPPEPRLRELR